MPLQESKQAYGQLSGRVLDSRDQEVMLEQDTLIPP